MKRFPLILIIGSSFFLPSCFAPKFQCETTKTGVCASPNKVYNALYSKGRIEKKAKKEINKVTPLVEVINPSDYRTPERIYRIWVTNYVDESGQLVGNHFIYVAIPGRWNFPKVSTELKDDVDYDRIIKEFLKKEGKDK